MKLSGQKYVAPLSYNHAEGDTLYQRLSSRDSLRNGPFVKSSPNMVSKRIRKQVAQAVDKKGKDFLTEGEMKRLLDAAKGGRYGQRDYLMLLMPTGTGCGCRS
jgi:integrase